MSGWQTRLAESLKPVLLERDPRPRLSAYHDMPYAIFHYPPEEEFAVRSSFVLLCKELELAGKRVTRISLAECLAAALEAEGITTATLADAEISVGLDAAIETVHQILSKYRPLDELVLARMPADPDPLRDVVLIARAGSLYPVYRTSSLLDQLQGKVPVPTVLFYPGDLDGATGLRFMGVPGAEHSYRPKIF